MNTSADKKNQRKSEVAASHFPEQKNNNSTLRLQDNRPQSLVQKKQVDALTNKQPAEQPVQKKENTTGLPDDLKTGIESLSGHSMDDVNVHYNSGEPAQLQAHAYAQGTNIHIASGQEKHLPHEAWHVVQQKQGRVKPTLQMKGSVNINDDKGLEKEADVMGAKAIQKKSFIPQQSFVSAATSGKTVQRFTSAAPGDYSMERENDQSHFFKTQSKEPELIKKKKKNYKIQHKITRSNDKQPVNIAEDQTLAISNTTAEPKEFYAADAVFNQAESKLAAGNSLIRLLKSGGLRLKTGDKVLYKITPAPAQQQQGEQAEEFADFVSHICIEFASSIMGVPGSNQHEAVFQKPGSQKQTLANITSKSLLGDDKIGKLALGMTKAENDTTPEELRESMHAETDPTDQKLHGIPYGKKLRTGALKKQEKKMGINNYAKPDVGEGFATFSMRGHDTKNMEYSQTKKEFEKTSHVWGYHFAGVVAKSLDGQDTITLENYNRNDDLFKQLNVILERLILSNSKKVKEKLSEIAPAKADTRTETREKLIKTLALVRNKTTENAQKEYMEIAATYKPEEAWFFAMQGPRAGQSFHEQQVAGNGFVNPLTLRVRPQDPAKMLQRSMGAARLMQYPIPPTLIASEPELKNEYAVKSKFCDRIMHSTDSDIKQASDENFASHAEYLAENSAAIAVKLARAAGVHLPGNALQPITDAATTEQKMKAAAKVVEYCHSAIENKINGLWITQVEEKMNLTQTSFNVFKIWKYIGKVSGHYNSKK